MICSEEMQKDMCMWVRELSALGWWLFLIVNTAVGRQQRQWLRVGGRQELTEVNQVVLCVC